MIARLLRLFTPVRPTPERVVPVPNTSDRTVHERPDRASGDRSNEYLQNGSLHGLATASARALSASASALAFWAAIVLPVLYLPLLATGLESIGGLVAFLGLFGIHLLALVAGRSHRRERRR